MSLGKPAPARTRLRPRWLSDGLARLPAAIRDLDTGAAGSLHRIGEHLDALRPAPEVREDELEGIELRTEVAAGKTVRLDDEPASLPVVTDQEVERVLVGPCFSRACDHDHSLLTKTMIAERA